MYYLLHPCADLRISLACPSLNNTETIIHFGYLYVFNPCDILANMLIDMACTMCEVINILIDHHV